MLAAGAATWASVGLAGCSALGGDSADDGESSGANNFVVTAETGAGSEGVPESSGFLSSCSASRRFVPGMQVVFWVGIFDPETGDQLTNDDLDSVVVDVEGIEEVELSWAGDDEEDPADEWGGSFVLPEDTEIDTYAYTVNVSSSDEDANFESVGILEDEFEVVEYDDPTNYVVSTETWWNDAEPEESDGFVGACAPERQFTQDMDVTFVIGVYDSTNGEIVGDDTLDSVTIESEDDAFDSFELEWDEGGEDSEPQWSGDLDTADLEPETYGYEVVVSNGDRDIYEVGIASNQFTIIEL